MAALRRAVSTWSQWGADACASVMASAVAMNIPIGPSRPEREQGGRRVLSGRVHADDDCVTPERRIATFAFLQGTRDPICINHNFILQCSNVERATGETGVSQRRVAETGLAHNQRHQGLSERDRVFANTFLLAVLGALLLAVHSAVRSGLIIAQFLGAKLGEFMGVNISAAYLTIGPAPMLLTLLLTVLRATLLIQVLRRSLQALPLQALIVIVHSCLFINLAFETTYDFAIGYIFIGVEVCLLYPLWMMRRPIRQAFAE
ncbi:hypothetical protein [Maricaulis sp.]|uniref:hypothetical protein n=1 Tax=Maricaulis sp. TaxID=1486257 RepID=UPI001B267A2C|nr:hypothetical protein [Maricaulis sp.]MBO6795953.1 hypothetical protein [Maricaulis sp.]